MLEPPDDAGPLNFFSRVFDLRRLPPFLQN